MLPAIYWTLALVIAYILLALTCNMPTLYLIQWAAIGHAVERRRKMMNDRALRRQNYDHSLRSDLNGGCNKRYTFYASVRKPADAR